MKEQFKHSTYFPMTQSFSLNIIGAGRLGKTLTKLLVDTHAIGTLFLTNSSLQSGIAAAQHIGFGTAVAFLKDLPLADIVFITVPDDKISELCKQLTQSGRIKKGGIVAHCSGALSSDILKIAKDNNAFIASAHPMRSFSDTTVDNDRYRKTYCALEGDEEACVILRELFSRIGWITYRIEKDKKTYYHVAGVFASNYVITLFDQALSCLKIAGVASEIAFEILITLMQSSLENLKINHSTQKALTGPLQRGDTMTIKRHIEALSNTDKLDLYKTLAAKTLPLTNLSEQQMIEIKNLIDKKIR